MFQRFYRLREQPFGVTPDPAYLYFSATHREALASLFYGIESGCGFLALIAQPGMGKTTLLFHLLEKLRGSAQTVFVFQTQCGSREFFRYLLTDLGADSGEQDLAKMHEALNAALLKNARAGRRVVLVIDEAQNLDASVLETVRLLSDFETPRAKLLQIILCGQPQLADKLANPSLTQLRQRISIIGRLHPFTRVETMVYIEYRLCKAGYSGPPLFGFDAIELIASHSGGVPRNINNLCFNALTLGCAKRAKKIDASIISEVLADLDLGTLGGLSVTAGPVFEDSLSSFDGVSPDSEESYLELHDAVRAAWGAETRTPTPEGGAKTAPFSEAQDSAQMVEAQSAEAEVPEPIRVDEVDKITAAMPALNNKPEAQTLNLFSAVEVGAATRMPASVSLPIAVDSPAEYQSRTALRADGDAPVLISATPLLETLVAPARGWKRFLSENLRKQKTSADDRRRATSSTAILALATLVGGGLLSLTRHRDPKPSGKSSDPRNEERSAQSSTGAGAPSSSTLTPVIAAPIVPSGGSNVVTVEPGETLGGVSLRYLGRATPHAIQQIQSLNPRITNPDLIVAGTKIHLPQPPIDSDTNTLSTDGNANPTEDPMSRTFELLRQAQRDQALLKQATQVSATNSRNFELVHQTAKGQQLFETARAPAVEHTTPILPAAAVPLRGNTFRLVQKLYLAPDAPSPRVLAFASVEDVSEHSRMCAHFAEMLAAQVQGSVCLVDANVTAPSLHRYLSQENAGGFAAAMTESGPVKDFTVRVGSSRLWLMPAGHWPQGQDWHSLLGKHLRARIAELRASFDCVLIAAPAASSDTGSAYLGSVTDGVVFIVEPSFTPREAARDLKDGIESNGGRVLGVILHRRELTLRELTKHSPKEPVYTS